MAVWKKTGQIEEFTPEELALLEAREPGLFASLKADELFAAESVRGWLNSVKRQGEAGRIGEAEPTGKQVAPAVAVQLPLWAEPMRAVPNGVLRSALFGAIRRGRRPYLDGERLAALEGIEIKYTGTRLDQGDLDAWEAILHTLRAQKMGNQCRTTSYALLKTIGLKDSGDNRRILHKRITRLTANAVEIRQGRYCYIGGLLHEAFKDEETQEWVITLNPHLVALFAPDQFTLVQWGTRRELAGQPLAQWLHGFYSSHAAPFPLRIETLHRLCGSETGELWKFTQTLKKALEAVAQACAAAGETFSWRIEGGLVYVERTPTAAQRRHLEKRGKEYRRDR